MYSYDKIDLQRQRFKNNRLQEALKSIKFNFQFHFREIGESEKENKKAKAKILRYY